MITYRALPVIPAIVLAVVALPGCGARDAQTAQSPSAQSSSASPTAGSAVTPAGSQVAAADLPAVVADRTFRGEDQGKPYAEYYAPDGTLRGKSGAETYTGSWKVVGEQLCFTYPKDGADSQVDCYTVFKDGDAVAWVGSDGQTVAATYVQGNPDKL